MTSKRSPSDAQPPRPATQFSDDSFIGAVAEAADVALWSICPDTGETWFSPVWYTILDYAPGAFEPSLQRFLDMMHPDDREPTLAAFNDLIEDRTATYTADFRLRTQGGDWCWIGASGSKVTRDNGLPYLVYGMQMDISSRKAAEASLEEIAKSADEARRRLSRLAENSPTALFEFRIDKDDVMTMPYITAGVADLLAVPAEEIIADGSTAFRNIFEEDLEDIGHSITQSRASLTSFRTRYRVKRPDMPKGFIWVQAHSMPSREDDGSTVWYGAIYDVTQVVEREEELARARDVMGHLALHDGLTALPNRRRFDEALNDRAAIKNGDAPAAVLIRVDLDRFKHVNDTLGHAAGDAVLAHVAQTMEACIGSGDMAFRVGGDEFCILLAAGRTVPQAEDIVGAIQAKLNEPFVFQGSVCRFGASFGIACSTYGAIENGDLMSFADAALYEAKAAGRGCLVVFQDKLHKTILENRHLASLLEAAIEAREFEPFFQPQICASTERLVGAEVLARWRRPDGEVIVPDRFLPVAEQLRAVHLIDELMVERAAETLANWRALGFSMPKVSFNVSCARLRDPAIVSSAEHILDSGTRVSFELLESILLEEQDVVSKFNLIAARERGIEIEVDDFGTGHASILGLLNVSPDALKIDRRLTSNVMESEQAQKLVSSILGIASALEVKTIAEGIETRGQAHVLNTLGCDVFQGHLYSHPLACDAFYEWAMQFEATAKSDADIKDAWVA